eukprot:10942.XXX_250439_251362_1 [CDS] Oithona nana genome sequencing.
MSDNKKVPFSERNDVEQDKLLLEPMLYLLQVPGKNVRKKLLSSFNVWMRVPEDKVRAIGELVQMLHNASLLLDDIEDNSILRRGVPVAHKIYGVPSTINSANYVMFICLERVLSLGHPEATKVFCDQMLELHRGQGMELYWRDNYHCPTEEEYRQMTIRKTGGLFNLAVRLMQLFSEDIANTCYVELTSLLGLYFQVRDDYANLCLEDYAANKSFAEDLTEGKFSFPVVHAIRTFPNDNQIMNIIRQRTNDLEVKKYCVSLLDKYGSFKYTLQVMEELDQKVRQEIAKLGGNSNLIALMDELKNWKK